LFSQFLRYISVLQYRVGLNNNSFSTNHPFFKLIEHADNEIVVIVQPARLLTEGYSPIWLSWLAERFSLRALCVRVGLTASYA
jgi:hypothetical protein